MALSLIAARGFVAQAQEPVALVPPSPWSRIFDLRGAGGYNDNVTLAANHPEQAPFVATALDAVVSRLPVDGTEFNFTLTAEDTRFLGPGSVDHETLLLTQVEAKKTLAGGWQPGLALQCFYQDQVLDVSTTETNQEALPVRGQMLTARPGLRLDLGPQGWVAVDAPINAQFFAAPLDDYFEAGPRASVGLDYGRRSEFTASYGAVHRSYEDDPALDADGFAIPGQTKAFWQHEVRLAWRHHWDERRRWRTTAKLGFKANRDTAEGYFDFNRYNAGGQFRYRAGRWEIAAEAGVYYYDYPVQTASGPGSANRERTEVTAGLRAERELGRGWRVFAEYSREQVLGNVALEEYSVNQGRGGLSWEF